MKRAFGQAATNVLEELKPLFSAYQTEQLVDAQSFKQLWQKHQAEITPIMAQLGSEAFTVCDGCWTRPKRSCAKHGLQHCD